jgi:deoxyribodipyrimidine photolyase-related protein
MHERRRLDIMMNEGSPEGKRWTFDKYNRRRMPGNIKIPELPHLKKNEFVKEAIKYVENQFPNHPGHLDHFFYPITHKEAEMWLDDFIKNKLALFGDYQDYIHHKEPYLFHSLLSSSINIGLLTPWLVVEKVLSANNIPLNSKEGFIRQIIGWREFLRAIYCREGCKQRTCNYLNNVKDIPDKVWNGKTGLEPFDKTINRVYQNAYAHHIERLMVIGNLFLLLGIHPDQVYRWFMMFFIDAYDWVMVPNVYGMSQYADGGLITTKPYVSSSNYLKNMSNYSSVEWKTIWDGLYWSFIYKNRELLLHNPRMALLKKYLKDEERLKKQLMVAESFLEKIFEYSDK